MIKNTHEWLCQKQKWYKKWHESNAHLPVHVAVLVFAVLLMGLAFLQTGTTTSVTRASGTTYYVNGDTGTAGAFSCNTSAIPCLTIQAAINAASAGDTILVSAKAGNAAYDEVLNFGGKNLVLDGSGAGTGTQAKLTDTTTANTESNAVLMLDPGPGSITSATVIKNFHFVANNSSPRNILNIFPGAYPIVMNNTFENSSTSINGHVFYIYGNQGDTTSAVTLSNNTITTSGASSALYIVNRSAVVKNNIIRTTGTGVTNYMSGTSVQFANNVLSGGDLWVSTGVNTPAATTTAVVANNTFDGVHSALRLSDSALNDGYTLTVYAKNNIFNGANIGIYIDETDASSTAQTPVRSDPITLYSDYNVFYPNPANGNNLALVIIQTSTYYTTLASWQAARGQDANSVAQDPYFTTWASTRFSTDNPYFVSAPTVDYTLRNYSPAIGNGTNKIVSVLLSDLDTYSLTTDLAGSARPKTGTTVDIGAYENQTMGDFSSLNISVPSPLNTATPQGQGAVTAYFTQGPAQDLTSLATWNSTNTAIAYVTNTGMVYGQSTGSAGISATFGSLTSNTASVTTSGLPDYVSIYVDADNGNDTTGDGSETAPLKTLDAAVGYFLPGARIFLKGTFTDNITIGSGVSGTVNNDTWFTNWPGYTATIAKMGSTAEITINGASYITIDGLNITGATSEAEGLIAGIVLTGGCNNITLNNNNIYGNNFGFADSGATGSNTNITVSNNLVHDNETSNILLLSSNTITFFNNVVYNAFFGITFMGASDGVQAWNNTLLNHGVGIAAYDANGEGDPTVINTVLKNNLIYQAAREEVGPAFRMVSAVKTGTGNSFDYNLYYAENNGPLIMVNSNMFTTLSPWQAASTHDDNAVNGDPLFAAQDDYSIDENSPAYGTGTSTGAPAGTATDITGDVNRLDDYDIGAYAVDLRPTAATNLVATGLTSSAFTLTWTDNASGLWQETNTVVKYSTTSATAGFNTTVSILNPDVTTLAVTGLTADTQYWFRVDGINSFGTTNSAALSVHTQAAGSSTSVTPPVVTPPTCTETRLSTFSSFTAIKNFVDVVKKNKVRATLQDYLDYLDFNCDGEFDLRDFVEFMRR